MKVRKIGAALCTAAVAFAVVACAGSGTKLLRTHVEENHRSTPIKDALVIVIVDDQAVRASFEKHFVDWLNVKGVEAVMSAEVLSVSEGAKLEKAAIIEVVDNYENDSILITHLVGMEETEVFSRDRPRYFNNYYGFYNYGWGYVTWPTIYGEKVQFSLETRLYDVKTESLIWSGESQTKNPKTAGQAIGQIVAVVIKDLEENGLLPKTQ